MKDCQVIRSIRFAVEKPFPLKISVMKQVATRETVLARFASLQKREGAFMTHQVFTFEAGGQHHALEL